MRKDQQCKAMKRTFWVLLIWMLTGTTFVMARQALKIGDSLPAAEIESEDTAGRNLNLNEVMDGNGLLVIFTCNTCPWVARWEDRLNDLYQLARSNDIGMIALNPNERTRDRGESMVEMKKRAQKQEYNFFYALDQNHRIADAFGAEKTPEVFLFNADKQLVYHGAIDDNGNRRSAVERAYLSDAITSMIAGMVIQTAQTEVIGCSIKRNE